MLGEQLKILSELELDFDLEAIGFEVPEIDLLIDGLNTVPEADPDDRLPEISGSAVSFDGDLWQLGKHRVLCGNCHKTINRFLPLAIETACWVAENFSRFVTQPSSLSLPPAPALSPDHPDLNVFDNIVGQLMFEARQRHELEGVIALNHACLLGFCELCITRTKLPQTP
jgi:hypothetical protein